MKRMGGEDRHDAHCSSCNSCHTCFDACSITGVLRTVLHLRATWHSRQPAPNLRPCEPSRMSQLDRMAPLPILLAFPQVGGLGGPNPSLPPFRSSLLHPLSPLTHGRVHLRLEAPAPLAEPLAHEGHAQVQRVLALLLRRAALVHVADGREHALAKGCAGEGVQGGKRSGGGEGEVEKGGNKEDGGFRVWVFGFASVVTIRACCSDGRRQATGTEQRAAGWLAGEAGALPLRGVGGSVPPAATTPCGSQPAWP